MSVLSSSMENIESLPHVELVALNKRLFNDIQLLQGRILALETQQESEEEDSFSTSSPMSEDDLDFPSISSSNKKKRGKSGSSSDESSPLKKKAQKNHPIHPLPNISPSLQVSTPSSNNIQNVMGTNNNQQLSGALTNTNRTSVTPTNITTLKGTSTNTNQVERGNLSNNKTNRNVNNNNNNINGSKVGKVKLPPVIAYNIDPKSLKSKLSSQLGHSNFSFKCVNTRVTHILTQDKTAFNTAKGVLSEQGLSHYSYTPSDEKSKTILLKRMPTTYDLDDVTEALTTTFPLVNFLKIHKFTPPTRYVKSKPEKYKNVHIWQITVSAESDDSKILQTKLLRCIQQHVRFEPLKHDKDSFPQCTKCQRYCHTESNCSMTRRCVRCGGGHDKDGCQLPKAEFDPQTNQQLAHTVPTCVNCGQKGHPANFRCSKYKELVKRAKESKANQAAVQATKKAAYQNYVQGGLSFADRVRPNKPSPPIPAPRAFRSAPKKTTPPSTVSPVDTSFYNTFQEMYLLAQKIKPVFEQIQNPEEKQALILYHLLTLNSNNGSRR